MTWWSCPAERHWSETNIGCRARGRKPGGNGGWTAMVVRHLPRRGRGGPFPYPRGKTRGSAMTENAPRRAVDRRARGGRGRRHGDHRRRAQPASAEPPARAPGARPAARPRRRAGPMTRPVDYHGWTSLRRLAVRRARRARARCPGTRPGLEIGRATGTPGLHRPAHREHRHLGVRHLDLAGRTGSPRPGDRADRLLERGHPGRHLAPGRAARHLLRRHRHPGLRDGPLDRGDGDEDIRRTSVDDQTDGKSSIWTDTFSIDDAAAGCCSPRTGCG